MTNLLKFFFTILFLTLATFNYSQERKVHYKLQKNEIIFYDEYVASIKFENQVFACIIEDTTTHKKTFVWNGEKKFSCDYILCYYVDLTDYDKCIIYYRQENGVFMKVENELYGPYDNIYYPANGSRDSDTRTSGYTWHIFSEETSDSWFYKNSFYFTQMGNSLIYSNGILLPNYHGSNLLDTLQNNVEKKGIEYKSLNQKHIAEFKFPNLLLDNKPYTIPMQENDTVSSCLIYIYDNGNCYGELQMDNLKKASEITYPYQSYPLSFIKFYIENQALKVLKEDEIFNFKKQRVEKKADQSNLKYQNFFRNTYYDNNARDFMMFDTSKKHYFISNPVYPYVLIDNKKFGKECAIYAWYVEESNEFCWITLEGNELVSYCYKL